MSQEKTQLSRKRSYDLSEQEQKTGFDDTKKKCKTLECTDEIFWWDKEKRNEETSSFIHGVISEVQVVAAQDKFIIRKFKLGGEIFRVKESKSIKGAFGEVYLYSNQDNHAELAIKYFNVQKDGQKEATVVEHLNKWKNHCGVIPGRVYHDTQVGVCIIMEKADPLMSMKLEFDPVKCALHARQITTTLFQQVKCLAKLSINGHSCYYTDLKPDNILVKGDRVMLADLGSLSPYSKNPDLYATTYWLPSILTGLDNGNQWIHKNNVKMCIPYLLAIIEDQILTAYHITPRLYFGEWWKNKNLLYVIHNRSKIYKWEE